jgi:GMP synthase (glutamine-hydrolysing)
VRVRRPLVVKTGGTLPALRERRGDYEDWIAAGMGLERDAVDVVAVAEGESPPDPQAPSGVVVTGSSAFVSERAAWSERTGAWLLEVIRAGTPLLAICYGHQLLAQALGGRVGRNPRGREIGTAALRLRPAAFEDPLLGVLESPVDVQETHVETVLALPPGVEPLAETDADPNQAFRVGGCAWGVQFHPEFDADVIRGYLEARRELIRGEGLDPEALLARVADSPAGPRLLRRFGELLNRDAPAAR